MVWVVSAVMAGIGGALYVPQVGIINPSEFAPGNSIEAVIWVAVGGRGTLSGARSWARCWSIWARPGSPRRCRNCGCTRSARMFIFVTLLLPRGLMGLLPRRHTRSVDPAVAAQEAAMAQETAAAREAIE